MAPSESNTVKNPLLESDLVGVRRRRRDLPGSRDVWYSSPFSRIPICFCTVYFVPKLLGISKYVQLYIERIRIQSYYKSASIFGQLFTVNSYISFLPFPAFCRPIPFLLPLLLFIVTSALPLFPSSPNPRLPPPWSLPGAPVSPPGPPSLAYPHGQFAN